MPADFRQNEFLPSAPITSLALTTRPSASVTLAPRMSRSIRVTEAGTIWRSPGSSATRANSARRITMLSAIQPNGPIPTSW